MTAPTLDTRRDFSMTTNPADDLTDIVVIIPVLNEEDSIGLVLADLPAVGRVVVVDNGSTDSTAARALACGAHMVREDQRGYGAACLCGLAEVERLRAAGEIDPHIIVFLDGDYSDHPEELVDVIAPIRRGDAELVIGSRLKGKMQAGAMPPQSRYGNKLACGLMRLLFGARYTDLGPFRAIRRDSLQQLQMVDENFGWTVEMQIKAVKRKLRTVEVPVSYRRRVGVSKISGTVSGTIRAGYKILYLIARYGLFDRSGS